MLDDARQHVERQPQRGATHRRQHVPIAERPRQLSQQQTNTAGADQASTRIEWRITHQVPRAGCADQSDRRRYDQAALLGPINQHHEHQRNQIDQHPHGHVREASAWRTRLNAEPRDVHIRPADDERL